MTKHWAPEGRIRWCWLELGAAALMLQEFWKNGERAGAPPGRLGLWGTPLADPDGYRLDFESPNEVPEETVYSDPA